jgi:hypothetical protein
MDEWMQGSDVTTSVIVTGEYETRSVSWMIGAPMVAFNPTKAGGQDDDVQDQLRLRYRMPRMKIGQWRIECGVLASRP